MAEMLKYNVAKGKTELHTEKQKMRNVLVKLIFRNPTHKWV
jgi:hypothetical protein